MHCTLSLYIFKGLCRRFLAPGRGCIKRVGYDEIREGEQQAIAEGKTVSGEQELWKRTWLW